ENPPLRRFLNALIDRRDELAGDDAAHDGIHESIPLPARERTQPDVAIAELAAAPALLLVPTVCFGHRADRLAVRDAGLLHRNSDIVLPPHPFQGHLEVHLSATARDRLTQ